MDAIRVNKKFFTFSDSDRGFTIVELLVATALSLLALSMIYLSFQAQQRSYAHQERVAAMQQNLRAALYTMEREIRMAGFDPTGSATAGITNPGTNTISFTMDLNRDGALVPGNEMVTYALAGTDLQRNTQGNTQVIAEYIQSLNFAYLDLDGNGTNDTVQVAIVGQTQKGTITSRALTMNIKTRNIDM